MKNIAQMMKQAQEMQQRMQEMQEQLLQMKIEGQSGGGAVSITIDGKGYLHKLDLDPSLLSPDEKEILEDLIIAAFNDAKRRAEQHIQEETSKMMGGLPLPPGFKLPF